MKKFIFSLHAEKVLLERNIKPEWIESTIENPDKSEHDLVDKKLEHKLKVIKEYDNRVLRVICNNSTKPVLIVTAFFDRRLKGKMK